MRKLCGCFDPDQPRRWYVPDEQPEPAEPPPPLEDEEAPIPVEWPVDWPVDAPTEENIYVYI